MNIPTALSRRHFVKLGTFAASAALLTHRAAAQGVAGYTLPPLPYALDALEPYIDAKTMEIHHGKHHAAYIANLNAALSAAPDLRQQPLRDLFKNLPAIADEPLRNALRNQGGGHWNHEFFWKTLSPPKGSGTPSAALAAAVDSQFGSMDNFKKSFADAAMKRFGSGWAWLILQDGKLKITSTANQDNPLMTGLVPATDLGTPLLALDVWEHAYYLHYQNRRAEYVTAWWNIVDWPTVSERFAQAARP